MSSKVVSRKQPAAPGSRPAFGLRSRSRQYRARGLHVLLKKGKAAPKAKAAKAPKAEPRVVSVYPEAVPAPSRRSTKHVSKPKADLVPGAVLILLAGKYRGKRVVLLSVLPSGLLLVSGPYRLNGVPLRRVNAAFVIATSTHVDVSGLKLRPEVQTDAFHTAPKAAKAKRSAGAKKDDANFFAASKAKKAPLSPERQTLQKEVDAQLLSSIKKVPLLAAYLRKPFSLSKGQLPHLMRF